MAQILDGKALAAKVKASLKEEIGQFPLFKEHKPTMALCLVGDDEGSAYYVKTKAKAGRAVGINVLEEHLPAAISQTELLKKIADLNNDPQVDAILVQLPLPGHLDSRQIIAAIAPEKDVDAFNPYNVGLLHTGNCLIAPCTPSGIMALLAEYQIKLRGCRALVIGRSNIVGRPMAAMLQAADATVMVAHSKTENLPELIKEADIVVSAAGVIGLIKGFMLKPGAVVVDVGQNRTADDKLVGDVDFASAFEVASYITPVPGGVGPLTIAFLLKNCVELAKNAATK